MCQLMLQNRPVSRIFVGRKLSWVLKLWHLTEAHIPPTISKNQKVWAFLKKIVTQKASQTLISTPPLVRILSEIGWYSHQ